ncbi:hypothetical protein FVE85_2031 [Porphyridium purpureum]|uniref:Uncharacterized protein n=1 Tax=Porphyridium purpureum TaxID=35688 RepID=A0A5J4YX09_PORPP|nr:hypothetical protein FVE85_2031 [Porphyridium purpureum]|eukprot:POR5468..scf209_3
MKRWRALEVVEFVVLACFVLLEAGLHAAGWGSTWTCGGTVSDARGSFAEGGVAESVHFIKRSLGFLLVMGVVPMFTALCVNLQTIEYASMTFAFARLAILFVFRNVPDFAFALDAVCVPLAWLINAALLLERYIALRVIEHKVAAPQQRNVASSSRQSYNGRVPRSPGAAHSEG